VGGLYIGLSDAVARRFASSVAQLHAIELVKGWCFIAVTSAALFAFARGLFSQLARHDAAIARQREETLRIGRRALAGAVASSVAHDSNNELQLATFQLSALREWVDPRGGDAFEELEDAVRRLTQMMVRLRDLGSPARLVETTEFDLGEEVQRTIDRLRSHPRVRNCRIRIARPAALAMRGYPVLVDEIVMNLVLNACEATECRGVIEVSVRREGSGCAVEVADDGPGVPASLRERVLEPFFTTKPDGTGLGLVSVRACATAHGGTLELGTATLGGALLTVRLESVGTAT
jgi:signal transduction histidine kinase